MIAEKQLDEFVSRIRKAAGENLQCVILYGSAAAGDFHPEFSNLNLLCILRETSFPKLSAIAPAVAWWQRQKYTVPLVLTERYRYQPPLAPPPPELPPPNPPNPPPPPPKPPPPL